MTPPAPTDLLHARHVSYVTHALLQLAVLVVVALVAARLVPWLERRISRPWLHRLVSVAAIMTLANALELDLVSMAGGTVAAMLVYWLVRRYPHTWWRASIVAVPLVALMPIIDAELNAAGAARLDTRAPALTDRIESLAAVRGVTVDRARIFLVPSPIPDARAAGIGPWRAVFVNEGALAELDDRELVFLAAHEVGHFYGPWVVGVGIVITGVVAALLLIGLVVLVRRLVPRTFTSPASLPVALIAIALLQLVATPLRALVQRRIERAADLNGLRLLAPLYPDARQIAAHELQRVGDVVGAPADDSIVDILCGVDHPPIGERIAFVLSARL